MSNARLLGIICGVLFGVLLVFVIGLIRKKQGQTRYDERQVAVRGNCYKVAYWVLTAGVLGYAVLISMDFELVKFLGTVGLCYVFFISIGVFVVLCIWNNAYEAMNENKQWPVTLLIIGISNLVISCANFMREGLIENGRLSFPWINLGCAILLVFIVIVKWIKNKVDVSED